jgi:flavin-binding protein dodecin
VRPLPRGARASAAAAMRAAGPSAYDENGTQGTSPAASNNRDRRNQMAKKSAAEGIYRVTEVIGTSTVSWEDAAKNAVAAASKSLRDLRIAEVVKLDMKVDNGKVTHYRSRILLSFKYDA